MVSTERLKRVRDDYAATEKWLGPIRIYTANEIVQMFDLLIKESEENESQKL